MPEDCTAIVIITEITHNHCGYIIRGHAAFVTTSPRQFSLIVFCLHSNCAHSQLILKCIYYDETEDDEGFKI